MKIATWNVNSVKARLPLLTRWLDQFKPDVALLQEIKCIDSDFPLLELRGLGYQAELVGQKTYNGVAVLSLKPMTVVQRALPEAAGLDRAPDQQARYLEVEIEGLRIASLYLPNGNPVDTEKYPYKLAWMERLCEHATKLMAADIPFVLGGDYNICPTDDDVYDPRAWRDDALCRPDSRARFRRLIHLGLTDAFRAIESRPHRYSFWDYQAGRWHRDEGLRIDHLLLSPQAADRLVDAGIDKTPRGWERASDHTPVWCELAPPPSGGLFGTQPPVKTAA
jgi:exodeoxyribonuclease-3